jgi:YidC/Oxa1 family membrane protein insertase
MFDTILGWIGSFLGWLDSITGNYVWALFIFAIIVEIILLPFAIKQQQNSIKQAKLRPKEMAIRNKYKGRNDRATQMKVSEEIQAMYQKEHFSPFQGCLQLFIQMPVILALYQVVINPLQHVLHVSKEAINAMTVYVTRAVEEGGLGLTVNSQRGTIELISIIKEKGIEFFSGIVGYVDSVGSIKGFGISGQEAYDAFVAVADRMPDFNFFGLNLAETPSIQEPSWLLIVPVLTFLAYFGSMKINRKFTYQPTTGNPEQDAQAGCSNKTMDIMMPMMSVWISTVVPAAIGVYWIFKSLIGTVKQIAMAKVMPIPVCTEEEYKAAEKEYGGKPEKKHQKGNVDIDATKNNSKSLFHQDDEDYVPPVKDEKATPEIKADDSGAISKAPLKEDRKHDKKDN